MISVFEREERKMPKRRAVRAGALGVAVLLGLALVGGVLCRFTPLDCRGHSEPGIFEGLAGSGLGPTELPAGFTQEVVARGLSFPSAFALLPDGRVLVAEKKGLVRVISAGRLRSRPLIDMRARVSDFGYRGLLAIELDPRFSENGDVYVIYVVRRGQAKTPTTVRVSRMATRFGGSETVVLGGIPCELDHCGADLEFAPDGTLFVATGDGGSGDPGFNRRSLRAQSLDSLVGKMLRVTREGTGLPGNPFWDGNARSVRSRIWAYGFRNPFRFGLRPGANTPFVGDVGWNAWEEIDVVRRGFNFGWPCFEGPDRPPEYAEQPVCRALYDGGDKSAQPPLLVYRRGSVTGGAFYVGRTFPPRYRGAYFYGDWSRSTLSYLRLDQVETEGEPFASAAAGPVQIESAADGSLYYLALNAGELRRIVYSG
jgi:glucose/arabinose dehydrogenase